ncbi:MAG: hypothetical protein KDD36_10105 [Flavobacteriales bacterium]|nr:hypothetical protein [Flavobacteriales bacterium]
MNTSTNQRLFLILKWTCFFLFAGRAYQHLVWDIPIRALLWDQDLMEGLITTITGMTWQEYATSQIQDIWIQTGKQVMGVFYALCAIFTLIINERRKWMGITLLVGSGCLTFLAFLYYKEKFFHVGQLFEYTAQVISPVLLYLVLFTQVPSSRIMLIGKVTIALTFTCHGLYAFGYYPQPGQFVDMVIRGFFLDEPGARLLLKVAGVLDFVISVGIFLPRRIATPCLWYAVVWGGMTALARVTTQFYIDFPWDSINQNLPDFLYRIPHAGLPLAMWWMMKHEKVNEVGKETYGKIAGVPA